MIQVNNPFPQFFDADGDPLDNGKVYFGVADLDPRTNPKAVYSDFAGTTPVTQPVRTQNGYLVNGAGTPISVYVDGDHSIAVYTSADVLLWSAPDSTQYNIEQRSQGIVSSFSGSSGSSLIGFIQSGTGAVARTTQGKMRESVSVKDFGAVGDGVTDDTVAIQAAIDSVRVGQNDLTMPVVLFPPGIYKTTAEIYVEAKPIVLSGYGATIKNSTSKCLRVGKYSNPGPEYSVPALIEGLVLFGFSSGVSYTGQSPFRGLTIEDCSGVVVRDCVIWGFSVGIYNYGGLVLTFDNVQLRTNVVGFQGLTGTFSLSNFINFINCKFYENRQIFDVNGGSYSFKNCTAERNNPTAAANVTLWNLTNLSGIGGTYCLQMDNVHCEGNTSLKEMYISFTSSNKAAKISCSNFLGSSSNYGIQIANGTVDFDQVCIFGSTLNSLYLDAGSVAKARSCNFQSVGGSLANFYVEDATGLTVGDPSSSFYKVGGTNATYETTSPVNNRWGQSRGNTLDYQWLDSAGNRIGYSRVVSSGEAFDFYDSGKVTSYALYLNGAAQHQTTTSSFRPLVDNTKSLGSADLRWSVVYASTGSINTSDERHKQQFRSVSDAEKRVALAIKSSIKAFKFNDAVAEKGDDARWHFGVVAQRVADAFIAEGLDPDDYSIFCYEKWDAQPAVLDDSGNVLKPAVSAGDRYGVRYSELAMFILASL